MAESSASSDFGPAPEPASVLNEVSDQDDEVLLLRDTRPPDLDDRYARLGGGPDVFVKKIENAPSDFPWKTIRRKAAIRLIQRWEVVSIDTVSDTSNFSPGRWATEFDTTAYEGDQLYPTPDDWGITTLTADGYRWQRPPKQSQPGIKRQTPQGDSVDEAVLTVDREPGASGYHDPRTIEASFTVNDTPVFTDELACRDTIFNIVAIVLVCVANGNTYPDNFAAFESDTDDDTRTLADFAHE